MLENRMKNASPEVANLAPVGLCAVGGQRDDDAGRSNLVRRLLSVGDVRENAAPFSGEQDPARRH